MVVFFQISREWDADPQSRVPSDWTVRGAAAAHSAVHEDAADSVPQ